MTNPGVQYPHCDPWCSTIAAWIGVRSPCGEARSPSTVTTCAPSTWQGVRMHDVAAR